MRTFPWIAVLLGAAAFGGTAVEIEECPSPIPVPRLEKPVVIDGDLSEWRDFAYTDGVWDIERLRQCPWFDPERNRLTNHGERCHPTQDLMSRYFIAWDETFLYLGAEVHDNANDAEDPEHEPKRWYYKDSVSWFMEAPRDQENERFGEGDHAFSFVIDPAKPSYGAWWRHGSGEESYIEEPLPPESVAYEIKMNPWGKGPGDYVLEARVNMEGTFGRGDPSWAFPREGHVYSLAIVHCDPDGGGYGGHLILYGTGDDDNTWRPCVLRGPMRAPGP